MKPFAGMDIRVNSGWQIPQPVRRHVRRRQHLEHAGHRARRGGIDRGDTGMCVRRTHEHRVRHTGKHEIVEIGAPADQKARVLAPLR